MQSIRQKMIMQMNCPCSISNFFILFFKTLFIASELQLYIPESITLFNCQCNVFLSRVAIIIAAFLKKTAAIETTVVSDCMVVIQNIVS